MAWFDVELRPAPAPPAAQPPPALLSTRLAPRRRVPPAPPATSQRSGGFHDATVAAPQQKPTGEAAPANAARRNAEDIEPPPRNGTLDLRPRWSSIPVRSEEQSDGAATAGGTPTSVDPFGGSLREHAGRARVEGGLVHPYYRDVGRELVRAWDVERMVEKRGVSGYLAQAGENLRDYGRVWQQVAEGYAKTGAPVLIDGGSERVKELSGLPAGPARDSLARSEVERQLRPEFSKGHITLVRVTQAADGRLLAVDLVSPSKDAAVDRAAMEAARQAAQKLPTPPDEARGSRDKLVSVWEFELEVAITPPIPLVEFQFDELLRVTDVFLPLDRHIWKRVRLVSVY
jgi:TonB family protein